MEPPCRRPAPRGSAGAVPRARIRERHRRADHRAGRAGPALVLRYFTDKRDVLFAGSERLPAVLARSVRHADSTLSSFEALLTALVDVAAAGRPGPARRATARGRPGQPGASGTGRTKFAAVTDAVADALRDRAPPNRRRRCLRRSVSPSSAPRSSARPTSRTTSACAGPHPGSGCRARRQPGSSRYRRSSGPGYPGCRSRVNGGPQPCFSNFSCGQSKFPLAGPGGVPVAKLRSGTQRLDNGERASGRGRAGVAGPVRRPPMDGKRIAALLVAADVLLVPLIRAVPAAAATAPRRPGRPGPTPPGTSHRSPGSPTRSARAPRSGTRSATANWRTCSTRRPTSPTRSACSTS